MKVSLPVRKAILERRTYEAPAEGRANKLRLDFNENTAGCSRAVMRALAKLSPKQIAMYPEYARTTQRLARHFAVRPSEMLLTNGGDEALRVFFDAFVDSGSSILICEPTFPMYRYYAEIAGARIKALRYNADMEFPLEEILVAIATKPRVVFVANPNNPTGTLLPRETIEAILKAASNTVVVIDEAYADFSGVTVVPWIRKYPHLFVVRTFSKTAGLAGLRLGAVIARAESLAILRRAMPPFSVNTAVLVAAEAAMNDRRELQRYVRGVVRSRSWLAKELRLVGVRSFPSAGNFLLADFGPRGPALFRSLERRGILLRERSKDIGEGFVRITIGTKSEMDRLMKEIRRHW